MNSQLSITCEGGDSLNSVDQQFNELYEKTYQKCFTYIVCKCSNTNDVADILQETYAAFYRVLQKKGITYFDNPEAYLIRVAHSKVVDYYSIKDRLKRLLPLMRTAETGEEVSILDEEAPLEDIPFEYAATHEALQAVQDFLQTRPQLAQKIFILYYYADQKIKDIASLLNMNESTVKTHLYRTTREVRSHVKGVQPYE